jgi:hypothetical protein
MVRAIIDSKAEKKYFTTNIASAAAATTAGTVYTLTQGIVEGGEINQRSGRKIQTIKSEIKFSANLPTAAGTGMVRFIWVADQMNTGVLPSASDILESVTVTGLYSIKSAGIGRFTVIRDTGYSMCVGGANNHINGYFSHTKKTNIFYSDATSVNSANGRGAMFLLVLSDLAANQPLVSINFGIKYVDI